MTDTKPTRLHVVADTGPGRADHDLTAEQVVLGAMMIQPDVIDEVTEVISAADFYRPAHGLLFTAILNQYAANEPCDPAAILRRLVATGDVTRISGADLHEIVAAVPTVISAGWYADVIAEHAQWRDLHRAGVQIAQLANNQGMSIGDARNRAEMFITQATIRRETRAVTEWRHIVGPAVDAIELNGSHEGPLGTPTGIADLDKMVNGLRGGQLVIIGARPGMGKSIFAVDCARHAAMRLKIPTAVFSLEMATAEIANRILSAETSIPLRALETGRLSDADWTRIAYFQAELTEAPLHIDDSASLNLAEIRSKARQLHRRHGLGLVVVDYLQLMTTASRAENRAVEVAELSRGLKLLAKELNCPVIAASQLNRNPDGRADKRPQLSDLRESGGIENDADIVILLHRDAYYDASKRPGEVDLIVAKNRNGPLGCVVAIAQLHLTRIVDLASGARP